MKRDTTVGELYDPAMKITEQELADHYFEELVKRRMYVQPAVSRETAEKIERENLGYWAGYGCLETRARVERLFGAFHPILPPTDKLQLTVIELLERGWNYAKEHDHFPWPRREGPFE